MPHQSYSTALGCSVEEGYADVAASETLNVIHYCFPCCLMDRPLVLLQSREKSMSTGINPDLTSKAYLYSWL